MAMTPDQPAPPIFITGVPRSGTTLLSAMLCAHAHISCGPETSFFVKLARTSVGWLLQARTWPREAVDFLANLTHVDQHVLTTYGLSRDEVAAYLAQAQPSVPALLGAVTELFMRRAGKVRWAEKTTSHLLHTAELRRYFPRSPILRIVRDPRDVALSLLKVPWGPRTFAGAVLLWRDFDDQSEAFFRTDPLTCTVRYEDLLEAPERELRRICAAIGEAFEPGMLDTEEAAALVNPTGLAWKDKVASGVDRSRIAVWQRTLTPEHQRLAEALVGDRLRAYGYPLSGEPFRRYVAAYPMQALAHWPEVIEAASQVRFWPDRPGEVPEMQLYLGDPDADGWLGHRRGQRLVRTAGIAAAVLRRRLTGRPVWWVREPAAAPLGFCARLLALVLKAQPNLQGLLETETPV